MSAQTYIPALIIISCVKGTFLTFAMVSILAGASLASLYLLPWYVHFKLGIILLSSSRRGSGSNNQKQIKKKMISQMKYKSVK